MVTFLCNLELLYTSLTLSLAVENIIRQEPVVFTLVSSINAKIGQQLPNTYKILYTYKIYNNNRCSITGLGGGEICQLFQAMTWLMKRIHDTPTCTLPQTRIIYVSPTMEHAYIQYTFLQVTKLALQTVIIPIQ